MKKKWKKRKENSSNTLGREERGEVPLGRALPRSVQPGRQVGLHGWRRWQSGDWIPKIKLPLLQYPPQTARFSRILHTSSRARVGPRKKWISLLTVQRATGPMSLFIEAFKLQNNPEITRTCLRGLGGFDSRKVSPVLTSGLSYSGLLSRTVFSSYFPRTSTINPK